MVPFLAGKRPDDGTAPGREATAALEMTPVPPSLFVFRDKLDASPLRFMGVIESTLLLVEIAAAFDRRALLGSMEDFTGDLPATGFPCKVKDDDDCANEGGSAKTSALLLAFARRSCLLATAVEPLLVVVADGAAAKHTVGSAGDSGLSSPSLRVGVAPLTTDTKPGFVALTEALALALLFFKSSILLELPSLK